MRNIFQLRHTGCLIYPIVTFQLSSVSPYSAAACIILTCGYATELNYLVKIDDQGKLRWARNDDLVDTSAGQWKDAGGGQGIIPEDMPNQIESNSPRGSFDSAPSVSANSSLSPEQEDVATHYVGDTKSKSRVTRLIKRHFTVHGMMDRLLRKTVQKNTWIYVSDKNCQCLFENIEMTLTHGGLANIFIGIKGNGFAFLDLCELTLMQ